MNLIDIIKNKIKFKNTKAFEVNYKEHSSIEKNSNITNNEDDEIESEISIEQSNEKKENILFEEFSKLKITEETRKDVLEHPERYTGCDVRTRMGKFYTDEEYEQRRKEVLSRPLPGGEEKGLVLRKKRK